MKTRLSESDHALLLALIRGEQPAMNEATVRVRLRRMRAFLGVQTNYQLIALEVVNLMESDSIIPAPQKPKAMAAGA